MMTMKRALTAVVLLAVAGLAAAADASDAARAELVRERRRLAADATRLTDVSRRLESALSQLASASRAVTDAVSRADVGADEMTRRDDLVAEAEQDVRSLLDRRRSLAERIVDRKRSIALLEADLATKKTTDVISGRWTVTLEPGEQRGVFRMSLEGTIVSGEYTLEGGYSGSLRGTLINDRVRLERVDSKLGFTAVFVGRVARDGATIAGTWEATTFGTGGPGSGRFLAVREEDREDSK
jgi:hypothetical protein